MPSKLDKQLGRQVLKHADNDQWESCLSILRHDVRYMHQELSNANNIPSKQPFQIWLHGSTEYGDYLVHLCAFAACESSLSIQKRKTAYYCLKLVLEWEGLKASQRVAGDGGTALHGALASASASLYNEDHEENDESDYDSESFEEEEEDDDDDDDDEEDNDYSNLILRSEIKRKEEVEFMEDITWNDEILTLQTISMLLKEGADPNTKLANVLHLDSNKKLEDDEDGDEMELNYAREAIVQQWNPLIMVIVWIALSYRKNNQNENSDNIELPYSILSTLLSAGADPDYEVGQLYGEDSKQWRAVDFAAICLVGNTYATQSSWNRLYQILLDAESQPLTTIQSFIIYILNNDVEKAEELLTQQSTMTSISKAFSGDFYSLQVNHFFPLPTMLFQNQEKTTLLELACYTRAMHSVKFLLNQAKESTIDTTLISESLCRNTIISLFESTSTTVLEEEQIQLRETVCVKIIDTYCVTQLQSIDHISEPYEKTVEYSILRQEFLDKLLLCTCIARSTTTSTVTNDSSLDKNGDNDLLPFILTLGSDPNVKSIVDTQVHGKQTPLHILAGNRHDSDGINIITLLLSRGSDINAINLNGLRPLQVALKCKNYKVAQLLWKYHTQQQQQDGNPTTLIKWLSVEEIFNLGLAATECNDVEIFKFVVIRLHAKEETKDFNTCDNKDETVSEYLGKLLLCAIDPRSGFATSHSNGSNCIDSLKRVLLDILLPPIQSSEETIIPSFLQNDISQKTALHLVLSQDRFMAKEIRDVLLRPLCQWVQILEGKKEKLDKNIQQQSQDIDTAIESAVEVKKSKLISTPCHKNFGGYTALHLACAMGCTESIQTLLEYGADKDFLDGQGHTPFELLSHEYVKHHISSSITGDQTSHHAFAFDIKDEAP